MLFPSAAALSAGDICRRHDLPCISESLCEAFGIDSLNAGAFFQRVMSSQGGAFAEDHIWRFHANRGKAYVSR